MSPEINFISGENYGKLRMTGDHKLGSNPRQPLFTNFENRNPGSYVRHSVYEITFITC